MGNDLCGWTGKILRVDLSSNTIHFDKTEKYLPQYIGGLGIGLKIMWDEVGPYIKPYDPENLLIFAAGPLNATWAPCAGRTTVISKSPITYPINHITRGSFGGHFGAELKLAGYDLIVIKGKAKEPVYLSIKDKKVHIKKALKIWGTDSFLAQKLMIEQEGDFQAKSIAIGQVGERCAYIASIISETGHASGQGGFGGVMGAKKLKGIIVRGTGAVRISTPYKNIQEVYQKEWKPLLTLKGSVIPGKGTWKANAPSYCWVGNPGKIVIGRVNADEMNRIGLRCNASIGKRIEKYHMKNDGCFGCLFNCYSYVSMAGLPHHTPPGGQITCQQFTSYWPYRSWDFKKLRVSSQAIFLGKQLADMYSINSIELRNIRHLLIYLKNGHGKLTSKQREELESLPWESEKTHKNGLPLIWKLTNNLAQADYREDNLWGIMSQGVIRAACSLGIYEDIYNGIDPKYGLNYTNHGFAEHFYPRNCYITGLLWMMENRDPNRHDLANVKDSERFLSKGGGITENLFGIKGITHPPKVGDVLNYGKIFFTKWILIRGILKDSLTLCDLVFPNYSSPIKERGYCGDISLESKIYSAVTGHQIEREELDKLAEGIWHLQRALTIRDWQTKNMRGAKGYKGGPMGDAGGDFRGHDNLSAFSFKHPRNFKVKRRQKQPPLDRQKYEKAKSMLYRDMGWDQNGAPTRKTLESFNLKQVADELDQSGLLGDEYER